MVKGRLTIRSIVSLYEPGKVLTIVAVKVVFQSLYQGLAARGVRGLLLPTFPQVQRSIEDPLEELIDKER